MVSGVVDTTVMLSTTCVVDGQHGPGMKNGGGGGNAPGASVGAGWNFFGFFGAGPGHGGSFLVIELTLMFAIRGDSLVISPLRKWLINRLKLYTMDERVISLEKSVEMLKQASVAAIRNDLTAIYNRAEERGFIGDWDRENFERMYKVYSDMGGNSYIHEVYKRIIAMPRKPKRVVKRTKKK